MADEHLATCADCRQKLGETRALNTLADFFLHDVELLATHLSHEQIESYIQGQLRHEEKSSVESHLRECLSCQSEVEDLRAFAVQFDSQPLTRLAPVEHRSFRQKLSKPAWLNNLRNQLAGFSISTWQMAGAAVAVALLVLAITFLLRKPSQNNNVTIKTTPSPIAPTPVLMPNQDQIAPQSDPSPLLPDEALPPQVDLAIRTERLVLPAEIAGWVERQGDVRGGSEKVETFSLISPAATFINSDKPTLRWLPFTGAISYTVEVVDANLNDVASASNLTSTQWRIDKPLARGRKYSWQVKAYSDGKELGMALSVRFGVLDKSKADELARAKERYSKNHLTMGVLYAQAGLLDDAEREFNAELKTNPQSIKASRLLQNLRAKRKPR